MKSWLRHVECGAWLGMILAILGLSAYVHWRAGFTFPTPWNDEPWFLWTSVELCETGHWASPSLRPEAPLVLSHLFAATNAVLYKLFGIGLGVSRWFSWTCMALAFLALLNMARRRPWPWLSAFVLSLFMLGPDSVIAGNMGRPEATIWMLAAWGFNLLERGKTGLGLLLVALTMNLHVLGYVFFAGALCVAGVLAIARHQEHHPWTGREIVWLGVAAFVALAAVAPRFLNFDTATVVATMNEDTTSIWRRLGISYRWVWLSLGAIAWLYCVFRKRDAVCFLSLALLGLLPLVLRSQMWYAVYEQQGYCMLLLALSWVAGDLAGRVFPKLARTASVAVVLGMLVFAYRFGGIVGPRNYPDKMQWGWGMFIEKTPPVYLTEEDKAAIVEEIARHLEGRSRPVRVFFSPEADGMFFHGLLPDGVIPYLGVRTDVLGDMAVFRTTRHMPGWALRDREAILEEQYGGAQAPPFRTRDGTESWLFVERETNSTE